MIKQISFAVLITTLLVGCGGSSGSKSSSSSAPAASSSSAASSDAPASSASSSSDGPVPSADLSFGFEEGIDGWYVNGSASDVTVTSEMELSHDMLNSALAITPLDWSANETSNWVYQARLDFSAPENLANSRLKVVLSIPEAYLTDGSLELQVIVHAADSDYGAIFAVSSLEADDNGDYIIERDTNVAAATGLGFQLAKAPSDTEIKEPVLVKSILIDRPEGAGSSSANSSTSSASNQLIIPVDSLDGWNSDESPASISVGEGIVVTPDWGAAEQTALYIMSAPIDLTNATITYVIHVPEAYVNDGNMVVQLFAQQNSGTYDGTFSDAGSWNPSSTLTAGDNTLTHGPFSEPPADIQRVGIKLQRQEKADEVTGDVIIRSITINFPE